MWLWCALMCASLGSTSLGLWASWTSWRCISFARLGKFSFIICSNKFSTSCSSSSPSGAPVIQMLERLKLSQGFLNLSYFFLNCFFILFWLNVYFFFLLQIIDLSPVFLPFTVGSLYIFLYFTLHSIQVFKVMKGKDLHPRLLYPAKLSFRMEGQIKCFPDKVKLKEFIITKPLLWNIKGLI